MDNRSESLDLIRGLAAIFVMIGHLRSVFFVPFGELQNVPVFFKAFYFITGYGHECVLIFFVLSGYFVGSAFHRGFPTNNLGNHLGNYAINRMVRLWVVLIPALILTLVLDNTGLMMTADKSIYAANSGYFPFLPLTNDRSFLTFTGNLFFLQTIEVPTLGSNGPLWSLANEFWYYLLFPLVYLLFVKSVSTSKKILLVVMAAALLSWLMYRNNSIAPGFLVWLMGFGAYLTKWKPNWILRLVFLALFFGLLGYIRIAELPYEKDIALGFLTSLVVISVRDVQLKGFRFISDFLSKISYTLYLIHLPIVIFLAATVFYGEPWKANFNGILLFCSLMIGIIGISYLFYYLFERNTDRVRKYVKGVLGKP
jgi:peptidoglycan/LPS O-acetylase OafA/YrhL